MTRITLAGCIILNSDKKLLLLHRNTPNKIQWELPGGKVEPDENPDTAAKREVFEELGVVVDHVHSVGSGEFEEREKEYRYYWFESRIIEGSPQIQEKEYFDTFRYFSLSELEQEHNLSNNMQNLILYPPFRQLLTPNS